jgi:hypothetical protein
VSQLNPSDNKADEQARLRFMAQLEREAEEERSARMMWAWLIRTCVIATLAFLTWMVW